MSRTTDPRKIDHPELREFALHAAWVAKLEETVEDLEDMLPTEVITDEEGKDLVPEGVFAEEVEVWDENTFAVALSIVHAEYEETERQLEASVTEWLAEDPEHWPIFRLVILDPWQERPGQWREDAPGWVRSLGTNTALAHFQQDLYGRQRVVDWSAIVEPDDAT